MRRYIFPFNKVCHGDKILIYGCGTVCKQYLPQILNLNYCECISIIDKNYEKIGNIFEINVISPVNIIHMDFDKIVIASSAYVDEIYAFLLSLNIHHSKIIKDIYTYECETSSNQFHISDYTYNPKSRKSLSHSKIRSILNEWYIENKDEALSNVERFLEYKYQYEKIPFISQTKSTPQWTNNFIAPFGAISIYGFLAQRNPRYYVEVGSGNTTLFAMQSIIDNNLQTKIISIDPFPRKDINDLCYKLYRVPLEEMDLSFFDGLTDEDILLIDNSHRSFPNSDVTVFFTEILPRLPKGLLYTLHDIYLPYDYPELWSVEQKRWYNEQYLLCTYLLGGGDKIILPNVFLEQQFEYINICEPMFGKGKMFEGRGCGSSFFWLEKV